MAYKIGDVLINSKVVLAPMAGVTNIAYRKMCKKYGAGMVTTEMISDKGIFYNDKKTKELANIDEIEHPVAIQIFGGDIDTLVNAAKYIDQYSDADIIDIFNKVKYPYNVNCLTQEKAGMILDNIQDVQMWVSQILGERQRVMEAFVQLDICVKLYPTSANFFLVEVTDAQAIYDYLVSKGIIVRNRTQVALCKNCLRITIGNRSENNELISALRIYKA